MLNPFTHKAQNEGAETKNSFYPQESREIYPKPIKNEELGYKNIGEIRSLIKNSPIEGNNGHWEGERGDGKWVPDGTYVPQKNNSEGKTWEELKGQYRVDGFVFKDGDLDLENVSRGTVEIDEITSNRSDNFDKADIALAEKKGCKPEDVANWRKEHKYTWHERSDGSTMQKVPSEVHGNISHSGGVAVAKQAEKEAA